MSRTIVNIFKYLFVTAIFGSLITVVFSALVFLYFSRDLPTIISVEDYKPSVVSSVYGANGELVGEYSEERRYIVSMNEIPDHVKRAFIAAEDDRFFDHQGVDFQSILRAAFANFQAGRVVQGGSTITQQVAKSLLLTPEKTFLRKIREVILAHRMERNLDKEQILFLYLNQIYLGNGAYGIEAAAKAYFRKSVKELTIAEAALLAGLPQAPSKYSPLLNAKSAKTRQTYVLRRMLEDGIISQKDHDLALETPLKIYYAHDLNNAVAPYYLEHIRRYLLEKYGKEALYAGGLKVFTPIDVETSKVAMRALQEGLRSVDKKQGYRGALKHISPNDAKAALAEISEANIQKKFPYKVLTVDGAHSLSLDSRSEAESAPSEGVSVLDEGLIYQAFVERVDDAKKEVLINFGFYRGIIPLDKMSWAMPVKQPSSTGIALISRPSMALRVGDVILVRVLKRDYKPGFVLAALEQEPILQGASLSVQVKTGHVMAMVGGYDFQQSEFNRALQAERQMGSTFKPIIYSAALDKGYTPASIIQDSPIVFGNGDDDKWKPENFEEKFYGDTLLRSALIRSRNIPTIKLVQDIGISYLIGYAERLGFNPAKFNQDLSISLGSSAVSVMDITKAYAVYPRGGRKIDPIFILKVLDREGSILEVTSPLLESPAGYEPPPPPKPIMLAGELQAARNNRDPEADLRGRFEGDPKDPLRVLDPRTAYVMTHLMNEVATSGTGAEAKALGRPAAGKTGTTNDYLDAWFVGFTPDVVTGVWVGFDIQKTIYPKATGAQISLPIWLDIMKAATAKFPISDFEAPKGIVTRVIDSQTGRLSAVGKPNAVSEVFVEGTEPGTVNNNYSTNSDRPASLAPTPAPKDSQDDDLFKRDIE